ncbi:MAG: hypothetical protein IT379_34155 [Deltaproteobacteria bacterium]|nr:hypothetical protein [Deltaproteobacteria bacterium]
MSGDDDHEALDRALAELPAYDLDERRSAQVHRRARGVLVERTRIASRPPWLRTLTRVYDVGLEPALVVCAAVVYLAWAVRSVVGPH